MNTAEKLQLLSEVSTNIIYIVGSSFIAGSAITIFVLLLLDFMRRNTEKRKTPR